MEQDADATVCIGYSNLAKHLQQLDNTTVL